MISEIIRKNRSCRRFYEDHRVDMTVLKDLVDLARLSASGANLQPLKYVLSSDAATNARIFPCLGWAGYLKDWPGPAEGERPAAYIIILGDTRISKNFGCDHGIAAQSMLLGATEKGLAGCMIGSVKRARLSDILNIPDPFEILLVLAIGKPKETIVIEDMGSGSAVNYWRDEDGIHHVPKRCVSDIIINSYE